MYLTVFKVRGSWSRMQTWELPNRKLPKGSRRQKAHDREQLERFVEELGEEGVDIDVAMGPALVGWLMTGKCEAMLRIDSDHKVRETLFLVLTDDNPSISTLKKSTAYVITGRDDDDEDEDEDGDGDGDDDDDGTKPPRRRGK